MESVNQQQCEKIEQRVRAYQQRSAVLGLSIGGSMLFWVIAAIILSALLWPFWILLVLYLCIMALAAGGYFLFCWNQAKLHVSTHPFVPHWDTQEEQPLLDQREQERQAPEISISIGATPDSPENEQPQMVIEVVQH